MSYQVRDTDTIVSWRIFYSLLNGQRVMIKTSWPPDQKKAAEEEAARLPGGKVSPRYGWKTVETHYPTCPKCGHQGESTGMRDYNYNGGGEYFRCQNPECKHKWCWS